MEHLPRTRPLDHHGGRHFVSEPHIRIQVLPVPVRAGDGHAARAEKLILLVLPRTSVMRMLLLGTESGHPETHPVAVYLGSLAPGSRRTMKQVLDLAASTISPGSNATTISWSTVGYQQVATIRSSLSAYAPSTANKTLAAVRGVLRQAFSLGQIDPESYQRAISIRSVRGERVVRGRAVSQDELKKMFAVCDLTTAAGARDAALLAIAYGAGLRRSEITSLDTVDYDRVTAKLIIRGKGNKERLAYVRNGSRLALETWLTIRGDQPGPIFLPVDKADRIEHRRMTEQAVYMILRRLGTKAKIEKFSPHDLRRTFIGDLLDAGADIVTVQALAAHASVSTTARYDRRGERTKQRAAELIRVPFGE